MFGGATYNGKPFAQSGAKASDLSDAQKKFLIEDNLRAVLVTTVESPAVAAEWNNNMQALVEGYGHGVPVNTSSDPRHETSATAEYNYGAGGEISHWPTSLGLAATFDPALVEEFVFRGVIFKALRAYGFAFAAVSSAVLFGVAHANVPQAVSAMVLGFFLAYITEITGDLKTVVLLHSFNNTVSFLFVYVFPKYLSANIISNIEAIYGLAVLIFAAIGIFVTVANSKKLTEHSGTQLQVTAGASGFVTATSLAVVALFFVRLILGAFV